MTPPTSDPTNDLVERLTGRWAVSLRGFFITLVLGLLGFATDLMKMAGRDVAVLLATLVAVFAVIAGVNGGLHRTRWRHRAQQPIPIAEFVSVLILNGALIAVGFWLAGEFFDLRTSIGVTEGFVVYPVLCIWIGSTVVLYLDVVDRARSIRQRAVDEYAASVHVMSRAEDLAAELHRSVEQQVGTAVEQVRQTSAGDHSDLPAAIREVVDGAVRATSRHLWQAAERGSTRIGIGEVVWAVIRQPRLRPFAIIGLAVVLPVVRDVNVVNWPTILAAVVISLVIALECWLANAVFRHYRRWRLVALAVVILVFSTQSIFIQEQSYRWGRTPNEVGFGAVIIFTVIFVLVTSMLGSYRDLDRQRAEHIAETIRQDRLRAVAEAHVVSEEARRLAGVLHGRVQSRLLGCAMALEFAGDDPAALQAALDRLDEVMDGEWLGSSRDRLVERPLSVIADYWAGVAEVTINGAESVYGASASSVFTVVEELVANSIRHGRARHVRVDITAGERTYLVVVADDGEASDVGPPGLGTSLMSRLGTRRHISDDSGWTVEVEVDHPG